MTMQAVDSMTPHTDRSAAALAAAGIRCALRYHYNISRPEVDRLHRAGIGVCIIGEFDYHAGGRQVSPLLEQPDAGAAHGQRVVDVARSLGAPGGAVLILTADVMVYPSQFDTVARYLRGAGPVIRGAGYRVGLYGGSLLIDWAHEHGLVDWTWEAAARSWSSPTGRSADYRPSQSAALRQLVAQPTIGGVTCDLNDYTGRPSPGEWLPDGGVSAGAQTPRQEDDDMPEPVYRFADPSLHPHGEYPILLRCGTYTLDDGRVGNGWHWLHLDPLSFMLGVDEGKLDDNPPQARERYRFAVGNTALDDRYNSAPHVFTKAPALLAGNQPPPPAPVPADPNPATVKAIIDAVADALHRINIGLDGVPKWTPSE
jgi:hypothetical protein